MHSAFIDSLNLREGEIFAGRYRVVGEIGRGGMGRVYRAMDLELDVEVAVKVIRPEFLDDERMIIRFRNEILLAREVTHENVVRIHDFAELGGARYITMQYVEGWTLRSQIDRSGPLPIDEIESLAGQICRGLEAARKKGIAHRDLKPQNILVDRKGHAYIADFGLARGQGQSGVSLTGVILGTPEYISPEQWKGERGDFRSDIYSLGITLYEMVTGRHLFQADSEFGYLHKHLTETPVFAAADKLRIPEYLRRVILRCLEKDPDVRYQNAAEVEADLKAQKASSIPLSLKLKEKAKKMYKPLTALALLVVLAWVVHRIVGPDGPSDGPKRIRVAVLPFENRTGEERFSFWSNALADLLTTDLGQSRYLQLVPQERLQPLAALRNDKPKDDGAAKEEFARLSRQLGYDYLLTGYYVKDRETLRVSLFIRISPDGQTDRITLEGKGEESLFSMIDNLTDKVKQKFRIPKEVILQDYEKDIRQITTSSLEALKAYSTGKEYYYMGRRDEALSEMEKAIAADNDFAMAYAFAARLISVAGDSRNELYYQEALKRLDRVSRRERFIIQGQYQNQVKRNRTEAIQCYRELLGEYPDDEEALHSVAFISRNMERWQESTQAYRRLEKLNPGRFVIQANLMNNEFSQGHYSEALDILEQYKTDFLKYNRYHSFRLRVFLYQGCLDLAKAEIDQISVEEKEQNHFSELYGDYLLLNGKVNEARTRYETILDRYRDVNDKIQVIGKITNSLLHAGKLQEARELAESLAVKADLTKDLSFFEVFPALQYVLAAYDERRDSSRALLEQMYSQYHKNASESRSIDQLSNLYVIGRLSVLTGDEKTLTEVLTVMDAMVANIGGAFARHSLHLRSEWALKQGKLEEAERYFGEAQRLFPNPERPEGMTGDFMHTLARIQTSQGRFDAASAVYSQIIDQNIGRLENAAAWVMAHAELARLYRRRGLRSQAGELAAKVVNWWQDGDMFIRMADEMNDLNK